jgi:zinc protease
MNTLTKIGVWLVGILSALFLTSPAYAVLPIEQFETDSGVGVWFVKADAIPMLDIEIRFNAGQRLDKFAGIGVSALTAALMDAGAGARSEAELADAFARIGAQRASWASDDSASVRLRTVLSEPELSSALQLFTDMLVRPKFEPQALTREKQRTAQAIREGDTRASVLAGRAYYRLNYGEHPYGYQLSEARLAEITQDNLREFHQKYYVQSRATIAIVGAIDRAKAKEIASALVAELPATGKPVQALPPVPMLTEARDERIEHPGAQSHILMGMPLLARGDPDYFPLLLGNSVLGGAGFVSRLYQEVREQRGLTYSVSSHFAPKAQPGLFTVSLQTQRQKTDEALQVVRQVLEDYVRDGPSAKELEAARSNLVGGFVFRVDSNRKILGLLSAIGFHGLPIDYLDQWVNRINQVTLAQVKDALARRINPKQMVTVVVGQATPVEK